MISGESSNPYRTIVVGANGSASSFAALRRAAILARVARAELVIACAYDRAYGADRHSPIGSYKDAEHLLQVTAAVDTILQAAVGHAEALGVERITPFAVPGTPRDGLLSVATDYEADLMVIGNREAGSSAVCDWVGPVGHAVANHSEADVLLVRPRGRFGCCSPLAGDEVAR
ncbi:universal stress protein [Nocardia arthritidis]|uniref:Universal stress protein n=1 Tax=Nocardia arthritidis TaxID=228602 RepID=A0A6G9Y960_9NOCA|nr:universal stress protein [Nocardia arthritidis]QIS09583.1 universal stress protein [Nocardia arthritidis]